MIEGVDALGHPSPSALAGAGKSFVGQYLKNLTRAQVDAYHAADVGVVLIGESTGQRSKLGAAAGTTDAHTFAAQAGALGAPDDAVIVIAEIDFDATATDLPAIIAYYRAAHAVLGARCWGYGGYRAIKALFDAGAVAGAMQTYAWSSGQWDRRAQIQQYLNGQSLGGTGVDYDRATVPDYGAWVGGNVMDADTKARFDLLESHLQADAANLKTTIDSATTQIVAAIKALPASGSTDPAAVATLVLTGLGEALR